MTSQNSLRTETGAASKEAALVDEGSGAKPQTLLADLGQFAAHLRLDEVPHEVREQAKLSVLDTLGCMIAGADDPDTQTLLDIERRDSSAGAVARVVGHDAWLPEEAAARVNSYAGDVFEHNDLVGSHASIATLPAAMATAEVTGATGAELLLSYICATEIVARLYASYYARKKDYMDVAIAPPGIINSIGSACGSGLLWGLDANTLAEAMALGGALAGWCPVGAVYDDGGTAKPLLHGAWPASTGLLAARYARAGMTGPVGLLESRIGLFATLAHDFDPRAISDPGSWHLANPRRKLHAACGYTHAGTDAVVGLRRRLGGRLLEAEEIVIRVPFYTFRAVSKDGPPKSRTQARFHLQFSAALAAIGEDRVRPTHGTDYLDWLAKPDLQRVLPRIHVEMDEGFRHYEQCAVEVRMPDGNVERSDGKPPRGAPANPMDRDMVIEKFRDCASARMDVAETNSYIETILHLDELRHCGSLYDI
ncbi:MmgE/PrpD family 2-methylcitrate dehydratase protein (plasmid) [Rhizobium gallicum]|uniref:MmgE/PrpD family 2-methylcitrate dehydratase protein n=1 Tax=Rhizobium gallicum TaxID=56730 RepID=A0A1L5NS63_9HYPH|nr:MmgE/PrpD family protein [Rhizobium gallicum]APO70727.1 MmgE/PrpD family 2-methylcitrate dehydratase protein [Rhizobium gallicum]